MKDIQCKHYKGKDDGYYYGIGDKQRLWLCYQCNLNLACEMLTQLATEVFASRIFESKGE